MKEFAKLNEKKWETCRIKYKNCECLLKYTNFNDDLEKYKCLCCSKKYKKMFDETFLQKDVYPLYEYMDDWKKFNENSLPEKESFYSNLNIENITDVYHNHAIEVCKNLKTNYLGEYHDFYVQNEKLLLNDVFEIFRNMRFEIYELDPACFLTSPGFLLVFYQC